MIAVGDISMLKPNSLSIPIDKDTGDIAVYLDEEYEFYIDIEEVGRLTYTVKPLTLKTEHMLISELNKALKLQLFKLNLAEEEQINYKTLAEMYKYDVFSGERLDDLIVRFSKCKNPQLILPELENIRKSFTKESLSNTDYRALYQKLVQIGYYEKAETIPVKFIQKLIRIRKLKKLSQHEILSLVNLIIDTYTKSMLADQEIYLKFAVVSNMLRYEREFKKKLLNLFSKKTNRKKIMEALGNSIIYSNMNSDIKTDGSTIPVF